MSETTGLNGPETTTASALAALCAIVRFHQISAEPAAQLHQMGVTGTGAGTTADMLGATQYLGRIAKLNRSIRENIAVADPAAPIEAVMRGAQLAGAQDFISELPEGYDTAVAEQGGSPSGSQRQRVTW